MAMPADRCGMSGRPRPRTSTAQMIRTGCGIVQGQRRGIGTLFHYARHGGWEDDTKKLYEEWCRKQGGQPKDDDEAKSKYLLSARSISYFEDFNRALKLDWVIKNLFAREHTSYLIAPPGGGKSALLSSAVTYLGVGKDWRGFKIPKRCASVIIPLERGSLVKKRIWAESAREGLGEVPVAVSPGMIHSAARNALMKWSARSCRRKTGPGWRSPRSILTPSARRSRPAAGMRTS